MRKNIRLMLTTPCSYETLTILALIPKTGLQTLVHKHFGAIDDT